MPWTWSLRREHLAMNDYTSLRIGTLLLYRTHAPGTWAIYRVNEVTAPRQPGLPETLELELYYTSPERPDWDSTHTTVWPNLDRSWRVLSPFTLLVSI